jgi:hypothetical protein
MEVIYKYPLKFVNYQFISLPVNHKFLKIDNQNDVVTLWALVETENVYATHSIFMYFTGEELTCNTDECKYLGTVQVAELVWHAFSPTL